MNNQLPKIDVRYRRRKIVAYCRQSTAGQVLENEGSTEFQRAQREFALELGWDEILIEVNDEDLGRSGAAADHRTGYQRIRQEIREGIVGAVVVTDHSRLSRNLQEWLAFLEDCATYDTLVFVDRKLVNITDKGELFTTGILALTGQYENAVIRERIRNGVLGKLHAGKAVTHPPVGYVKVAKGEWGFDPDASVQAAIRAVFQLFLQERSCARTVKALTGLGIKIPSRPAGRPLRWQPASVPRVRQILRNRRYSGDYIYREQVVDPRRGRNGHGQLRVRRAREDETIVIPDHHPAYVDREQWFQIQEILHLNAPSAERRNLGPGSALLQGIVRCGMHGNRAMAVAYKPQRRDGGQSHLYFCLGDYRMGRSLCGHFAGRPLDEAVVAAVLARLAPPSLQAIREEWRGAKSDAAHGRHLRVTALNQAKQRAADLEVRFFSVNPINRLVKEDLEAKLEEAKREVNALAATSNEESNELGIFTEEAFEELLDLCSDLPGIFNADTTTFRDRKEIIRRMLKWVVVEERTPEKIRARVVWADGTAATIVEAPLFRAAYPTMGRLAAEGLLPGAIATALNSDGYRTARGRAWSADSVRAALNRMRQKKA